MCASVEKSIFLTLLNALSTECNGIDAIAAPNAQPLTSRSSAGFRYGQLPLGGVVHAI